MHNWKNLETFVLRYETKHHRVEKKSSFGNARMIVSTTAGNASFDALPIQIFRGIASNDALPVEAFVNAS